MQSSSKENLCFSRRTKTVRDSIRASLMLESANALAPFL